MFALRNSSLFASARNKNMKENKTVFALLAVHGKCNKSKVNNKLRHNISQNIVSLSVEIIVCFIPINQGMSK